MKKIFIYLKKYLLFIFFTCFILIFSFFNLISKDKDFSEMENRYLQKRPSFSLNKFLNNDFSDKYERFVNDQFILRDEWINLKMLSEILLLKSENNNIVIGKDNYLFEKLIAVDEEKINKNIDYITKFAANNRLNKIFFTIIPSSYEILKDKLPFGLNNIDQTKNINKIYKNCLSKGLDNLNIIDSESFLESKVNNNEKIYYCTDHHWTTTGAYFFYEGLSDFLNYKPIKLEALKKYEMKNFYGTYYSKAKIAFKKPDDIFYYAAPIESMCVDNKIKNELYDLNKFKEKDKYAAFLHGNNGLTIIDCKKSKLKKKNICIIKDSFANSFIPFLTYNYNDIYVLDLRYIRQADLKDFIYKYKIDDVLIMYSFSNFISDNNILKLGYFNDNMGR